MSSKTTDSFGQVMSGEMVPKTRFGRIKKLPAVYSLEHEFDDEALDTFQTCFEELADTNMRVVDTISGR